MKARFFLVFVFLSQCIPKLRPLTSGSIHFSGEKQQPCAVNRSQIGVLLSQTDALKTDSSIDCTLHSAMKRCYMLFSLARCSGLIWIWYRSLVERDFFFFSKHLVCLSLSPPKGAKMGLQIIIYLTHGWVWSSLHQCFLTISIPELWINSPEMKKNILYCFLFLSSPQKYPLKPNDSGKKPLMSQDKAHPA